MYVCMCVCVCVCACACARSQESMSEPGCVLLSETTRSLLVQGGSALLAQMVPFAERVPLHGKVGHGHGDAHGGQPAQSPSTVSAPAPASGANADSHAHGEVRPVALPCISFPSLCLPCGCCGFFPSFHWFTLSLCCVPSILVARARAAQGRGQGWRGRGRGQEGRARDVPHPRPPR
jgi:hypothetical protein